MFSEVHLMPEWGCTCKEVNVLQKIDNKGIEYEISQSIFLSLHFLVTSTTSGFGPTPGLSSMSRSQLGDDHHPIIIMSTIIPNVTSQISI